jgi:Fe2+ transport system protein FeoA
MACPEVRHYTPLAGHWHKIFKLSGSEPCCFTVFNRNDSHLIDLGYVKGMYKCITIHLLMRITLIYTLRMNMTLADLSPGDSAKLDKIDTQDPGVIRLMILGMVEDITVRMENIAIGGDPLEVGFFGSSVSLRKEQARHFKVTRITSSPST